MHLLVTFQVIPKSKSDSVPNLNEDVGLLLVKWIRDDHGIKLEDVDIEEKSSSYHVVICSLNSGKLLPGHLRKVVQEYVASLIFTALRCLCNVLIFL